MSRLHLHENLRIFAFGIGLVVQNHRPLRTRLDGFLHEFDIDRVFNKHCHPFLGIELDGEKERPLIRLVNPTATPHIHRDRNFQQLHPRLHQKYLNALRGDLRFEFIQNDVMNHVRVFF